MHRYHESNKIMSETALREVNELLEKLAHEWKAQYYPNQTFTMSMDCETGECYARELAEWIEREKPDETKRIVAFDKEHTYDYGDSLYMAFQFLML
jgi:hypothetical protein